jgi:hypothetical protein
MNTNVEINKQYIRDHITIEEQAEFYTYFLSLPDSHSFDVWTIDRTAEVEVF